MKLEDPLVIRGCTIKNRIVMEPMMTFSFHGDGGSFYGSQHLAHYTARAKGGAGLIILQATAVFGAAVAAEKWSADNTDVLRRIAENCHEYGAAVMMQLSCGDADINAMTVSDIHAMQRDMVQAAVTAGRLGFDVPSSTLPTATRSANSLTPPITAARMPTAAMRRAARLCSRGFCRRSGKKPGHILSWASGWANASRHTTTASQPRTFLKRPASTC